MAPRNGGVAAPNNATDALTKRAHALHVPLPEFRVDRVGGADHKPLFRAICTWKPEGYEKEGLGHSKMEAKRAAAAALLSLLDLRSRAPALFANPPAVYEDRLPRDGVVQPPPQQPHMQPTGGLLKRRIEIVRGPQPPLHSGPPPHMPGGMQQRSAGPGWVRPPPQMHGGDRPPPGAMHGHPQMMPPVPHGQMMRAHPQMPPGPAPMHPSQGHMPHLQQQHQHPGHGMVAPQPPTHPHGQVQMHGPPQPQVLPHSQPQPMMPRSQPHPLPRSQPPPASQVQFPGPSQRPMSLAANGRTGGLLQDANQNQTRSVGNGPRPNGKVSVGTASGAPGGKVEVTGGAEGKSSHLGSLLESMSRNSALVHTLQSVSTDPSSKSGADSSGSTGKHTLAATQTPSTSPETRDAGFSSGSANGFSSKPGPLRSEPQPSSNSDERARPGGDANGVQVLGNLAGSEAKLHSVEGKPVRENALPPKKKRMLAALAAQNDQAAAEPKPPVSVAETCPPQVRERLPNIDNGFDDVPSIAIPRKRARSTAAQEPPKSAPQAGARSATQGQPSKQNSVNGRAASQPQPPPQVPRQDPPQDPSATTTPLTAVMFVHVDDVAAMSATINLAGTPTASALDLQVRAFGPLREAPTAADAAVPSWMNVTRIHVMNSEEVDISIAFAAGRDASQLEAARGRITIVTGTSKFASLEYPGVVDVVQPQALVPHLKNLAKSTGAVV